MGSADSRLRFGDRSKLSFRAIDSLKDGFGVRCRFSKNDQPLFDGF